MPDCPNCHVELGFGAEGGICPKCLTVYKPEAVMSMPGYDNDEVLALSRLYAMLLDTGQLKPGLNSAELYDDGVIHISHEPLD